MKINNSKVKIIIINAISFVLAIIFMHFFCYYYYNVPIHYNNNTKSTDYVWETNKFYSRMTEGFGFGVTNNEGFNNLADFDSQISIDVLLMGSSHMEAFQVMQKESAPAILNSIFAKRLYTYNIGMSGHTLPICVRNLSNAINYYKPEKYIVFETNSILFSTKTLSELINGTLPPANTTKHGIKAILQRNHFLHLLNTQIANLQKTNKISSDKSEYTGENIYLTNKMLAKIKELCEKSDITPIIIYHSPLIIVNDTNTNTENVKIFSKLCRDNNIVFIDMTPIFNENYRKYKILPHGFSNTTPNSGHLNKEGHKMIAYELYKKIDSLEQRVNGF